MKVIATFEFDPAEAAAEFGVPDREIDADALLDHTLGGLRDYSPGVNDFNYSIDGVFIVRRVAMDGEIDEIVNICKSKSDARQILEGYNHLGPIGPIDEWMQTGRTAHEGIGDDSESVWIEAHNLI